MKFTNGEAFNIYRVLMAAQEKGKLGYAIAKNRRKFEDELKEYFPIHDGIVQKYGVPDGMGGFNVLMDRAAEYQKEIDEYDGMSCEVDVCTVDIDTFTSGELTSRQMYVLEWMAE